MLNTSEDSEQTESALVLAGLDNLLIETLLLLHKRLLGAISSLSNSVAFRSDVVIF